ncbi:MAG: hypothetical protein ACI92I_000218 [Acidimicrobiales bacterium]|jgi:hypothetical protein
MNQVTQEQKDSVTKTFAIVGFIAAILFAVWLAVQIVSVIPSAFSSLASIADGVYNYNEDQSLIVATQNSIINTGESFTLSWTEMNRSGAYAFSYACAEGVSIEIRDAQNNIGALDCNTPLSLGIVTSLDLVVASEKQRFTDVTYTVTYTPSVKSAKEIATSAKVTIVNIHIPTGAVLVEEATTIEPEEGNVVINEITPKPPTTNPGTGLVAGTPTTIEEIIYAIPTSDPNGKIDMQVTFLGIGKLSGKTFVRTATLDKDENGAFQFEVKNVGTKTADSWSYEANLPSGIEYNAGSQKALKPNEKAIITIGFEGLTQVGTEKIGATVTAKNDVNKRNNSFTWSVKVVE